MTEIEQFKCDRNEALMSMDEGKIRAYMLKYNGNRGPSDPTVFWGAIHKAITGCLDLPKDFRQKSKDFLAKRGWKSFDDGDLK